MDARGLFLLVRRWPGRRIALVAAAAVPFVASLGFCSIERSPGKVTHAAERPALVFDQYFVNLSDLHNAARVEAWYHFKNNGKAPAKITKLEPSCGCLDPKVEKRTYMPGEECEFPLGVLMTREKPGPHEYSLKIDYQDPQPQSVTIAFKVVVRREVTVRPSQLQFWQDGMAETKQTIVITDMRPTPFRVTGVSCKSPFVKAQIGGTTDDADAGRETSLTVTVAAEVPKEGVRTVVIVTTDDPRYPKIPIAVHIDNWHYRGIQQTSGIKSAPTAKAKP
jgi:Protein of unknown function (DUF1573)